MFPLDESEVSFDSNVVVDFDVTGNVPLLEQLLPGRMLISDFVEAELRKANITFSPAQIVELTTEEHLELLEELRRLNPQLGLGDLGAISVAKIRCAVLASNETQTRDAAKEVGVEVSGTLGILEHGVASRSIEPKRAVQVAEEMISAGATFSEELIELFKARVLV